MREVVYDEGVFRRGVVKGIRVTVSNVLQRFNDKDSNMVFPGCLFFFLYRKLVFLSRPRTILVCKVFTE